MLYGLLYGIVNFRLFTIIQSILLSAVVVFNNKVASDVLKFF